MEIIKWSDDYSVGINEIDNQHKGLVIIINELFNLISEGKSKNKLEEIFNHLTDYTKKHFTAEEKMMEKFAYPL
ncbi:hemerythrin domain-containing protein, partial [Bacteroidota bacterium]